MDKTHLLLDEIAALQTELDVLTLAPNLEQADLIYRRTKVIVNEIKNDGICKSDAKLLDELGTLSGAVESELTEYRNRFSANLVACESEGKASAGVLTALLTALGAILVYLASKLFKMFFKAETASSGAAATVASKPPVKLKLKELAKLGNLLNIKTFNNITSIAAYLSIDKDTIELMSKNNHELFESIREMWGHYETNDFDKGVIVLLLRSKDVPLPYRNYILKQQAALQAIDKHLPNASKLPIKESSVDIDKFETLTSTINGLGRIADESTLDEIDGDYLYGIDKKAMINMQRAAQKFDEDVKAFSIAQSRWANNASYLSDDSENSPASRYNDIVVLPLRYVRNYQTGVIVRWYSNAISAKVALDTLAERLSKLERNIHQEVKKMDDLDISGKSDYVAMKEDVDVRERLSALEKIHTKLTSLKRDVDMVKFTQVLPVLKSSGYLK